jgi:CRP-like cAMP-binding protein
MNDATRSLSGIELFDGLDDCDREALTRLCRWHRYAAHKSIIGHEDETNDVYFVVAGKVRVTVFSPSGKEVAFRDLPAGRCFGELAAIDGAPRSATVIALSDTVLASMSAKTFRRALHDHPVVAANMVQYLAGLVRKLSDRVVEFSVLAVRNRIHAELLRLTRRQGLDGNTAIVTPAPTHADIASRVSTHREAVTRELNALARAGLIERRDGALVIADVARLARLVERGFHE